MPRKDPTKSEAEIEKGKKAHREKVLKSLKNLLETDKIDDFEHFFSLYKRTNLAKDIHMGQETIKKRVKNPISFSYEEIKAIAGVIGVATEVMDRFVKVQIAKSEKHNR
jgi:hypothetical protein